MPERRIPEMVGASDQPVELGDRPTTARVAVRPPTGPVREAAEARAAAPDVFLRFQDITGGEATSYEVYLNVPEGADPAQHSDRHVGQLPMFGVAEASAASDRHPGSGLHYSLDATKVVRRLAESGEWDPLSLKVTFIPKRRGAVPESAAGAPRPIRIGQVSVYLV